MMTYMSVVEKRYCENCRRETRTHVKWDPMNDWKPHPENCVCLMCDNALAKSLREAFDRQVDETLSERNAGLMHKRIKALRHMMDVLSEDDPQNDMIPMIENKLAQIRSYVMDEKHGIPTLDELPENWEDEE